MRRFRSVLALVSTMVILLGCSSAKEDWNKATAADTVAAYQDYLNKHPSGDHSSDALNKIHSLQDDAAWAQAKETNTVASYQDYLEKQPAGSHTKDAQDAVTAQQRSTDWQTAQTTGTVAALQDFLKKYPDGSEAGQARTKLADLTAYRVRIASAKTERQAQHDKEKLATKYGKVIHEVVVVSDPKQGYTVASQPMSQTQAQDACSELKKSRLPCEVVKNDKSSG